MYLRIDFFGFLMRVDFLGFLGIHYSWRLIFLVFALQVIKLSMVWTVVQTIIIYNLNAKNKFNQKI